ncbi:class I SAM-dependent methyltransferase [Oscillatoria sp. FACHB-1407]|uniref:class I SAM-dependent methyltransferase n=1 Tax=Oscillatoria sp. FACHB-1407 TaxID=2692847 RepID=UPI0016876E06|nr:class I SAM-dependent methyltransferase [Oscillatoria sp. FACHB-1407]MBD2462403.1 class I SAM-dependent methyltransferase [Oscillatoria sp. FACHB-1407]
MSVKPYRTIGAGVGIANLQVFHQRAGFQTSSILREAEKIEDILRKVLYFKTDVKDAWDVYTGDSSKLKNLNSFGKQIVSQMLRSNPEFQGFKVEFKDPVLKPDVLFLLGTLCDDFDHMNTSPLYGFNVLDIGCGSLSPYGSPEKDNLLDRFYSDQPPIAAELLQILGAHTVGIDSRPNSREVYDYQTTYKHRTMEFCDVGKWLTSLDHSFDIVSCINLFNKSGFAYHYNLPHQIIHFLTGIRKAMSPGGLLYCTLPIIPSSPENKQLNEQIFNGSGFKVIYEGYYVILQAP